MTTHPVWTLSRRDFSFPGDSGAYTIIKKTCNSFSYVVKYQRIDVEVSGVGVYPTLFVGEISSVRNWIQEEI